MKLRLTLAAATLLALSGTAAAQEAAVEGAGYRVGESTFVHPRAGFEAGYITNVFHMANNAVGSAILRLAADISIASESHEQRETPPDAALAPGEGGPPRVPPKLTFRAGASVARNQYVSPNGAVKEQSNISGGVHAKATAFPAGTVSFKVQEKLVRHTRPVNFEDTGNLNRIINQLSLGLTLQPPGRSLHAGLRYENTIDVFESDDAAFANRIQHLIGFRAGWQYLPVTRFTFDASLGFYGQLGNATLPDGTPYKRSSMPLRIGVAGSSAITSMTTAEVHVGFGKGFYSSAADFTNVLFGTRLGWRYSPLGRATLAYQYGFADSINANFYRDHALLAKVDQQLGVLLWSGSVGLHLRGYRGIPPGIGGPASRDDLIFRATVGGQYFHREWLAFTGQLVGLVDETDYRYAPDPTGLQYNPSFSRWEVWVGTVAAF